MIEGSVLDLAGWGYWVIVTPFIVMALPFVVLTIAAVIWAYKGFRNL